MIPEGTDAKSVSQEQVTTVAADVETFRRAHSISRKAIARTLGYSAGVVSEFLAGKYNGDNAQVAIDMEGWLVEEESRLSRPETTQFVWTNVAAQMKATAGYCLDRRKIGLLYGADSSGVGKTKALQAINQELGPRRSTLCTIDKVDANPSGLLRKLCQSMHIDDKGSNKQRFDRLKERLTGVAGRGRSHLLMIDQIHNLRGAKDDKPLYILTDLFDATHSAQLWVGTADMVAYLKRQQRRSSDESLTQICRRIFPRVDLLEAVRKGGGGEPLVTVDQVRQMFAKNKLKITAAAARFLCSICNRPDSGSIGLCVEIIEYVTETRLNLPSLDVSVLKEALARGLTAPSADLLLQEMEDEIAAIAKVA